MIALNILKAQDMWILESIYSWPLNNLSVRGTDHAVKNPSITLSLQKLNC